MAGPSSPLSFRAPTPLEYSRSLVADDDGLPLVEAAPRSPWTSTRSSTRARAGTLDGMAARLKRRLPADAAPLQRLRSLNRFFFQELQFAGNVNDYYDRRNSYLHCVLEMRRGIPISLAVLYVELAREIGLQGAAASPSPATSWSRSACRRARSSSIPSTASRCRARRSTRCCEPYRKRRGGLVGDFECRSRSSCSRPRRATRWRACCAT